MGRADRKFRRLAIVLTVAWATCAASVARPSEVDRAAAPDKPLPDSGLRFRAVADEVGVGFRYTFGDFTYDTILESSGSGVTWLDVDGDGDLDLYLLNGVYLEGISDPKGRIRAGATNRLYCNEGGRFVDCTTRSGLDDGGWSMAAAPADFDEDGDTDLFVASYGPNRLYRNLGDGRFADAAEELGLVGPRTLAGFTKWSVGGAWFDADRDGDLDLMVCNFLAFDPDLLVPGREWEMPEPGMYRGQPSVLYRQEEGGGFEDVTEEAGLLRPESKCMGITVVDWDRDGRLDLFQGNDHQPNFLFRDRGDGTYEEIARQAGVAVNDQGLATGSMHGSPGDVDGDGRIDLLVTDLRHGSLYRQVESQSFEDVTWESGVGQLLDGLGQWGAGLYDLDLDGDLDLFTANGVAHVLELQAPTLAVNDGSGRFRDGRRGAGPYFSGRRSGRGAAFGDYDLDGDLDIAVNHVDHRARASLLENESLRGGHWVAFRLIGRAPRDAMGARVEIAVGDQTLVRIHQPCAGYLSCNDSRIHFGLGPEQRVSRVTVRWPSGLEQVWADLAADRAWVLHEGGMPTPGPRTR